MRFMQRYFTSVAVLTTATSLLVSGCATSGFRTGLGPQSFQRAPYYTGRAASGARFAWLPATYQRGGAQSPNFDPRGGPVMAQLLDEMNAYLDGLDLGRRLEVPSPSPGTPPDVRLACAMDAAGDCIGADDDPATPAEQGRSMTLSVEPASGEFSPWIGSALSSANASHAVMITLEIAPFWPRQTGLRGTKVVDLGSGYSPELPWLTSLDQPLWVIELTGAVLDSTGHVVRAGGEGLLAKRTRFAISAIGGQEMVSDADVAQLRSSRRTDLPGSPLVWQAAMDSLVRQLTGRTSS